VKTVAPTDVVPTLVDAIQYETGEGPCLTAIYEHATYLIDDLADDRRWPVCSGRRAVEETGVRCMLSFRLFLRSDTIGALNLYSRRAAGLRRARFRGRHGVGRARRGRDCPLPPSTNEPSSWIAALGSQSGDRDGHGGADEPRTDVPGRGLRTSSGGRPST
jgi:hypothetical protein